MTRQPGYYWVRPYKSTSAWHTYDKSVTLGPEIALLSIDDEREYWDYCGSDEGAGKEGEAFEVVSGPLEPPPK